jgi:hypothetical protein
MQKIVRNCLVVGCLALSAVALGADALSDAQIRELIVQESIQSYPGNCPCPFNADSAGRRCGGRSAYSRAGGYAPICYAKEVTDEQVRDYRARHKIPKA